MKKIITNFIMLQLLIILFVPSILGINNDAEHVYYLSTDNASRSIIYVDDDGGENYTKIQDAIDNATAGDTIIVYNGTYQENIIVNKKLDIIGSGDSNIAGILQDKPVVTINVDKVKISTFIICGFFDGIFLSGVEECQIINNQISNNEKGVYLIESFNNVISNNLISFNTKYGIMLQRCAHNYILNNEFVSNEGIAVLMYDAGNNEIEYNNFQDNEKDAFFLNAPINYWEGNYWNRARIFPKIIFGIRTIIPWVNFDWQPARVPNDV